MWGKPKKRKRTVPNSPEELATALIGVVFPPDEPERLPPMGLSRPLFIAEIRYLLTFAVDYACLVCLGEDPRRLEVLDAFYRQLEEALKAHLPDPGVWRRLEQRLGIYAEAAERPTPGGVPAAVGGAFGYFCQRSRDTRLVGFAATLFDQAVRDACDLIGPPSARPRSL